ncbi:MAG: diaminopimelate decarboxylase [Thermoleophilaceae bacterium]|nr:diaminopimelate decarboxylase [Thermoleophilaceae bacterium]
MAGPASDQVASVDAPGSGAADGLPWHVWPLGSRLNEAGRIEVGGCDLVELAREFGTPAYVYAEDDIRTRARAFLDAFRARRERFEVVYASKAFPCTAAYELLAAEGLSCDVASGGELHLALRGGFDPSRIYMHGNNKSEAEIAYAVESGVGHIVADSFDELERLERIAPGQRILLRVTPGIKPSTHSYIQTGQIDSKFGFSVEEVPRAIESIRNLELRGLHAHIGSQIFELEPYEKLVEVLARLGDYPLLNLGGGLGIAYTREDEPPSIDEYVDTLVRGAPEHVTVLCEPGRALVGNAGVTIYSVGTVKEIPGVRTYVAVDGGMSDNLRPMLYGSRYEAEIASRPGGADVCTIAGMHCESGDILVRDVGLDSPRPGDILAIPATGAYGHAMANNYNAVPRPPVIFCKDGDARVVVRRETYEDLTRRDV